MSWNAKPMAKPIMPAPANKEVTVPCKPRKSNATKIPESNTTTFIIDDSRSAICIESSAFLSTLRVIFPTILAIIENIIAMKIATTKLGRC